MTVDEILAYAAERKFPHALQERWLRMAEADRAAVCRLVARTRPGANQMREFLDHVEDLAARHATSVAAVLDSPEVVRALESASSRNEAIAALRRVLRRLRFPELTAAERRLQELARSLGLPHVIRIAFPPDLEGDEIVFRVHARTPEDVGTAARALLDAAARPEMAALFRVLGGEP